MRLIRVAGHRCARPAERNQHVHAARRFSARNMARLAAELARRPMASLVPHSCAFIRVAGSRTPAAPSKRGRVLDCEAPVIQAARDDDLARSAGLAVAVASSRGRALVAVEVGGGLAIRIFAPNVWAYVRGPKLLARNAERDCPKVVLEREWSHVVPPGALASSIRPFRAFRGGVRRRRAPSPAGPSDDDENR